jgi:hypothetical protein
MNWTTPSAFAALIALTLMATPAEATRPRPVGPQDICAVNLWYQRYLGRDADAVGIATWTSELCRGHNAEAGILGSEEYLQRHGGTPDGFVVGLYFEVLNRPPGLNEVQGWVCRLQQLKCNRVRLAEEFLRASKTELAQRCPCPPVVTSPPVFMPGTFTPPPPGPIGIRFNAP